MSHDVWQERFVTKREPAWHLLGTVFTEALTASEAIKLGRIDYEVTKYPLVADLGTDTFQKTPVWGIFREPTLDSPEPVYFGVVHQEYQVVQNTEIAQIIDPITKLWGVETAGALQDGKLMFLMLDAGEMEIKGDLLHQYFMVSDWKAGGRALRIDTTPMRVVCGNTFRMGISAATMTMNLNHAHKPKEKLAAIAETIVKMQESQATVYSVLESIANKKVNMKQVEAWVEELYPVPAEAEEGVAISLESLNALYRLIEKKKAVRAAVLDLYKKFNDEAPKAVAGTGYAFYNAVVEMEDYRYRTNALADIMFGGSVNVKKDAFEMALKA